MKFAVTRVVRHPAMRSWVVFRLRHDVEFDRAEGILAFHLQLGYEVEPTRAAIREAIRQRLFHDGANADQGHFEVEHLRAARCLMREAGLDAESWGRARR